MRRTLAVTILVSSIAATALGCGARTTSLTDVDFTGGGGAQDSGVVSDVSFDSGPSFDARPNPDASPPPFDARRDSIAPPPDSFVPDFGRETEPFPDTGPASENTVGTVCKDDATCDPLGTGDNKCASDTFSFGSLYPTPVCIGLNCDPGSGTTVMPCDNGLGICLSTGGGGGGICLPVCKFDDTGAAPTGCIGKDACNVFTFGSDPATGKPNAAGYCFGGCTADADCSLGKCQKESGLCVKTVVSYSKTVGTPCSRPDAQRNCECLFSGTTDKGYCSQFCHAGDGTGAATCPTGFTCSASLPTTDPSGAPLFTTTPKGAAGYCLKSCATDADCTALNAKCTDTTDGRVCTVAF